MAETWVLNATITVPPTGFSAAFTSNGMEFSSIYVISAVMYYRGTKNIKVYTNEVWTNSAYRTLVFDTSPTGNLLTWLQANGVKQGGSDPEPETPTNACLIDGTVYGIKTGTALVNGMAQTIYNGRTLVAGAGYDIVLSSSGFTVTITGSGAPASENISAYVIIDGVSYTAPATLTVEAGTTIEAHANSVFGKSIITLNGAQVRTGTSIKYEHTVTTNTNVRLSLAGSGNRAYGRVDITTT